MKNIYNYGIILSFLGLWITSIFSGEIEIILGFILIFSFGILHGSNDILLIDSFSNSKTSHSFLIVLSTYLLGVFSVIILLYTLPAVALVIFVVFSGFHFGEQHWEYRRFKLPNIVLKSFYLLYGLLVLQILFFLNQEEVKVIVNSIISQTIPDHLIWYSFIYNVVAIILLSFYMFFKSNAFKKILLIEIFYLIVFTIIFKVSTLIWGFTIYFIFWHSIPSLFEQVVFIYGDFSKKNLLSYCKKAFPYWIISLIGITVAYFIFKNTKIFNAVFFSFIASVTLPHALIINKMFGKKKTQSNK